MQKLESLREVESLRFRFQMNNRLRLESLAELSKLFREFGEPISDDLLSSLVFALPQELVSNGYRYVTDGDGAVMQADADESSPKPPNNPPTSPEPNNPPTSPKPGPNTPPASPSLEPNAPPVSPTPMYSE